MAPPFGFQKSLQIEATDELGSYFIYEDRVCKICSVQLTTRNRYGWQLYCERHGRERDRIRMAESRGTWRPEPPQETVPRTHHVRALDRDRMHSLLTAFLNQPTKQTVKDDLLAGLRTYEIKQRMSHL